MRRLNRVAMVLVALAATCSAAAKKPVTLDDLLKLKNISAVELSPDGKRVAYVVSQPDLDENTVRTNIYLADTTSGKVTHLTNALKHDDTPRWSPDGQWLAFVSDRDAKPEKVAKRQVWVISPEGGEAWQMTRTKMNVNTFAWAPDGKRLALVATEAPTDEEEKKQKDKDDAVVVDRDTKLAQIHLASVPDGKTTPLYSGQRHITSIWFSPDGQEVVFADQPSPRVPDNFHSAVRVLNVASKQVRDVGTRETTNYRPRWSPDGKYIAFSGQSQTDWAGNNYLYVAPAGGGAATKLTAGFDEEAGEFQWADDSSALFFTAADHANSHIYRATLDGKISTLQGGSGINRAISISNGRVAWVHEDTDQPPDVYYAALRDSGSAAPAKGLAKKAAAFQFTPKKLTDLNPEVGQYAWGKTETVRWKNKTDGMDIEGLLVTPPDYQAGKAYPLLLVIHGGPAGQWSNNFKMRGAYPVQAFASQGYVLLLPNPRGSGGYGDKFRHANVRDWGGGDYHDIQDGVDAMIERGIADKDHMGVMGWSYGGYMTSWTITQTSRFKAASVGAGVTNLFSMYGVTDIPPFLESYFGKKPWEDRELMAAHSAMYFTDKVQTPTLIQHGMEDRRVPISQGEELYTALRARGLPVEMVKYPRSEHGFTEPKLMRDSMVRNVEWFDRYVKGNSAAAKWHVPPQPAETRADLK